VSIIIQQDATIYSLFISANRSTCFGWYLRPSSGTHNTVSKVSDTIETVTATSRQVAVTVSVIPDTTYSVNELLMMGEIPPETCRAVCRYK